MQHSASRRPAQVAQSSPDWPERCGASGWQPGAHGIILARAAVDEISRKDEPRRIPLAQHHVSRWLHPKSMADFFRSWNRNMRRGDRSS